MVEVVGVAAVSDEHEGVVSCCAFDHEPRQTSSVDNLVVASQRLTRRCVRAANGRPIDNRFDQAFTPFKVRVEYDASLGTNSIDDGNTLRESIDAVVSKTYDEMLAVAHRILDQMPKFAPILHKIDDLVLKMIADG